MQNCRSQSDFLGPLPSAQQNPRAPGHPVTRASRVGVPQRGASRDEAAEKQRPLRHGQLCGHAKVFENDTQRSAVVRTQLRRNESQPAVQNTNNCGNFADQIQIQSQIQLVKKNHENLNKVDFYEGIDDGEDDGELDMAQLGLEGAQTTEKYPEQSALFQPQIITQQRSNLQQEHDPRRKSKLTRARSGVDIDISTIMQEKEKQTSQGTTEPIQSNPSYQQLTNQDTQLPRSHLIQDSDPNAHDENQMVQSARREHAAHQADTTTHTLTALSLTQPVAADNLTSSLLVSKLSESKVSCHPAQAPQGLRLSCSALLNFEELIESRCQTARREDGAARITKVEGSCGTCGHALVCLSPQLRVPSHILPACILPAASFQNRDQASSSTITTANCANCGNFVMVIGKGGPELAKTEVLCQAMKEHPKQEFRPDFNLLKIMKSLKKFQGSAVRPEQREQPVSCAYITFNERAKYLKYRRKTVRALFQTSERFGFNTDTVHHAIALFDGTLVRSEEAEEDGRAGIDAIECLRSKFASCKGVISEQICTFVAAVSLFISAKYHEIKYPVVEDVCQLMQCPFTFDEFIEMEAHVLQDRFLWDLQIPTVIEALQALLSQGVIFTSDTISFAQKREGQASAEKDGEFNTDQEREQTGQSPQKSTVALAETNAAQREALFARMWKLCMSLLPNLLVYDAPLALQSAQAASPVHLALAIIVEARRSLGIHSSAIDGCRVSDVALLLMAFGDALIPEHQIRPTSDKPQMEPKPSTQQQQLVVLDMIKEMEKVYELVAQVQQSLYNKTFKMDKCFLVKETAQEKQCFDERPQLPKDSELKAKRMNPTPLPHSDESAAFSSTHPTTENVKNKDSLSVEEDGKPSLHLRQLKIDDGHIESLTFPSREQQLSAAGSARPPIMFPQVEIQGSSTSSNSQSKDNSVRRIEAEGDRKRSSNAHHYKYSSINSLNEVQARSLNSARVTTESLNVSQNLQENGGGDYTRRSRGQNEMTIYESLKVDCRPPIQVAKLQSQQITDTIQHHMPQRSTYQTIRSQSSSHLRKSIESSSQRRGGHSNRSHNGRVRQSKSKSSTSVNAGSKSTWSNNGEVECNEVARAKPVRISAQLEVKVTKATDSGDISGSVEHTAKSGKGKAQGVHRARKGSCSQMKQSNSKPLLMLKKQATHTCGTSRNAQQMTQAPSVLSLHQDSSSRGAAQYHHNDPAHPPQTGAAQKKKHLCKPTPQQSEVAHKLKSARRKNSDIGKHSVLNSGIETSHRPASGAHTSAANSRLHTHRPNPSSTSRSKQPSGVTIEPAPQGQQLVKTQDRRSTYRKSTHMRSHCSQTTLVDQVSSARNSSSSAVRHKLNQQAASSKRLTAGRFQRQKDLSESNEACMQSTGETSERVKMAVMQNYVSQELVREKKAGVAHNPPRQGNVSFRGLRSSQRGSIGAVSQAHPRKGSRHVASGQGVVASFGTNGKPTADRPATSRLNGRQSQGNAGYVTARAHHQAAPADPAFGPKIPPASQSSNQNMYTIQYPKDSSEVLFTEGSMKPQVIQQLQAGQQAYFTENIESTNQTPLSTRQSALSILPKDGKTKLKQNAGPLFASRKSSRRDCQASTSHSRMSSKLGSHTTNSFQPSTVPTQGQTSSSKTRQTLRTSCGITSSVARRQTNQIQQKLPLKHALSGDLHRMHDGQSSASGLQKPPKSGARLAGPQKQAHVAITLHKSSTKPSLAPATSTARAGGSRSRKSPIINRLPTSRQGLTKGGSSKVAQMQPCSERQLQQAPVQFQQAACRITPRGDGGATSSRGQQHSRTRPKESLHQACRNQLQVQQHGRLRSSLQNTASTTTVHCADDVSTSSRPAASSNQQKMHTVHQQLKITPHQLLNR